MSVVNPVRYNCEPDDALCRLSQELPSQAIGPCTRCATSTIGCSAILAPSNAQPPAAAPGFNCLEQPFLRSASGLAWLCSHAGSSKTCWILTFSVLMEDLSIQTPSPACGRREKRHRIMS